MQDATLLFMLDTETDNATIEHAVEEAGKSNAHLRCALYSALPVHPFNASAGLAVGGPIVTDQWPEMVAEAQSIMQARAAEIESILARLDVAGSVSPLFCANAEVRQNVSAFARTADAMYFAGNLRDTPDIFDAALHAALFEAPVGVVLNTAPLVEVERIFLAWDDSNAAARAAHLALPYLKRAGEVTIGCFDPITGRQGYEAEPGADLAAWLSHHGCIVTVAHCASGGQEIGSCISSKAKELGAGLIVMGAYGHSRMRQAIFGGTTRTMIKQTEQAVFLAH